MKITKLFLYALTLFNIIIISSCGGNDNMMALIAERDSLRLQYEIQSRRLNSIEKAVSALNTTMDSIAKEEDLIFININGIEATREDAIGNLDRFEFMIQEQGKRIDALKKELAENVFNSDAQELINYLQDQLALKDKQIAQLRKELENKNVDIARLRKQVEDQSLRLTAQSRTIDELTDANARQKNALKAQDKAINTGYVLINTKDELRNRGIIDKKGKIVSDAALRTKGLASVDIRNWREVSFSAKKPKILTNMPTSSYELTTNGMGQFILKINNPTDFWSISNYLIIQTN